MDIKLMVLYKASYFVGRLVWIGLYEDTGFSSRE